MTALRGLVSAVLLLPALCAAAIDFPRLTGRIVDNAGMLDSATEHTLGEQLAAHERATTNQIVVVTLPDLQGYTIEEFGYQLGRHWGIGQKGKNNGVLLLVAPQERAVRIEVGYGLEGELTDAISANIIHAVILPQFRTGNFEGGITLGARSIIEALGGQYVVKKTSRQPVKEESNPLFGFLVFIVLFIILMPFSNRRVSYGSSRSGGRSGGGFRGGGGSFGGGGASGRW